MKIRNMVALAAMLVGLPAEKADAACETKAYYRTNYCTEHTSVMLETYWSSYSDWWEVGDDGSGTLGVAYAKLQCQNVGVPKVLHAGLVRNDPLFGPVHTDFVCADIAGNYPLIYVSRCGNEVNCAN